MEDPPSNFPYEIQDVLKERYEKSPNNIPFWMTNEKVNGIKTNDQSKLYSSTNVCYSIVICCSIFFFLFCKDEFYLFDHLLIMMTTSERNHSKKNYLKL